MDKLAKLLEQMQNGSIVPTLMLEEMELTRALDQRDDPSFDEKWMAAFQRLQSTKGKKDDANSLVTEIRELAYLQAYERWRSSDLAAAISDDFGLIGDALTIGIDDAWLNGLLDTYLAHRFPCGPIQEHGGQLGDRC